MLISDFAIKKPIVTVTVMLALVVFGLFALGVLKTDEFPDIQQPIVVVTIVYPGASPETVEREVVDPIEDALFSISGIDGKQTIASAIDGLRAVHRLLRLREGRAAGDAGRPRRDQREARRTCPLEMEEPIITRFDPADLPIVSLTLTSDTLAVPALTRLADEVVKRELRAVQGVADVRIVGGQVRELTVELRPEALAAAGVSAADVVRRAPGAEPRRAGRARERRRSPSSPSGSRAGSTRPRSSRRSPSRPASGQVVRLGQVATAQDGAEEQRTLALFDGGGGGRHRGPEDEGLLDDRGRRRGEGARAGARGDGCRRARSSRWCRTRASACARSVHDVADDAPRGRAPHRARRLPLPQLLALDRHHRPRAAGLGARRVHQRLGVRLHAQHDVAARPLARDRHPHRRRHRGAREHRAAHRDGGGPHHRLVQGHRRDRARGRGDDLLDRRGVRPDRASCTASPASGSSRSPSPSPRRCSSRSSSPSRSTRCSRPTGPTRRSSRATRTGRIARALGAFNRWFDRQADRYKGVVAWALDHRLAMFAHRGGLVRRRDRAAGDRSAAAGFVPDLATAAR